MGPDRGADALLWLLHFLFYRWAASVVHEASHLLALIIVTGPFDRASPHGILSWRNLRGLFYTREVTANGLSTRAGALVRHAGWIASCALAAVLFGGANASWAARLGAVATALDALTSDLLLAGKEGGSCGCTRSGSRWVFRCGNFGIILLNPDFREQALETLRTMVRVTMMRGAQSGGAVTYVPLKGKGLVGIRSRVVNGKRTDLSKLIHDKIKSDWAGSKRRYGESADPIFFAGHTRFATTSKATFDGTHPHQWTPPTPRNIWTREGVTWDCKTLNVESFICHNGDLDAFEIGEVTHSLEFLFDWIQRATHAPCPSGVDSAAVAGIIELLRTKGSWYLSLRFGFLFGPDRPTLEYKCLSKGELEALATIADQEFKSATSGDAPCPLSTLRDVLASRLYNRVAECTCSQWSTDPNDVEAGVRSSPHASPEPSAKSACPSCILRTHNLTCNDTGRLRLMMDAAVDAFLDQDLLAAVRLFLASARGSFGLCVTSSLDAHRQLVVASRGQTISVAFYPVTGIVLWGSEQAAVKAAVDVLPDNDWSGHGPENDDGAMRLDMDDLGGEVCLIDWGKGILHKDNITHPTEIVVEETVAIDEVSSADANGLRKRATFKSVRPSMVDIITPVDRRHTLCTIAAQGVPQRTWLMGDRVSVTIAQESLSKLTQFRKRLIKISNNPLVLPIPRVFADPVAKDISDIPKILHHIQEDWASGESFNRLTAWCLGKEVIKRLKMKQEKTQANSNNTVDILITGCEVSLWQGEQFASDLSQVFPNLNIKCVSANKLLGLLGQDFPIPQSGHQFHESSWNLNGCICLIISHSGGTFAPLAVSNLLQGLTPHIFVVASEWDTQIGKQLRQLHSGQAFEIKSAIFTTFVGMRPAEPCTISVVATHALLTEILIYLMQKVQIEGLEGSSGGSYLPDDITQLEHLTRSNVHAMEDITGYSRDGTKTPTAMEKTLREKGAHWGQHVLEGAVSWVLVFIYILVTVLSGYPLCIGIAKTAGLYPVSPEATLVTEILLLLDALIYVFSPQWCCLLLRLVQGRPLLHRMTGRALVIGDIPWVAQSLEAYVSKLFACAYSAASISVWSANPGDHLVHRMTHRVVRGGLVACGRPDGRLMALTSAENSVCLSVNQASSIMSINQTCETMTIGHNPYALGLAKHSIFLNAFRKMFLCEHLITKDHADVTEGRDPDAASKLLRGRSSGALLGEYTNLKRKGSGSGRGDDSSHGHDVDSSVRGKSGRDRLLDRSASGRHLDRSLHRTGSDRSARSVPDRSPKGPDVSNHSRVHPAPSEWMAEELDVPHAMGGGPVVHDRAEEQSIDGPETSIRRRPPSVSAQRVDLDNSTTSGKTTVHGMGSAGPEKEDNEKEDKLKNDPAASSKGLMTDWPSLQETREKDRKEEMKKLVERLVARQGQQTENVDMDGFYGEGMLREMVGVPADKLVEAQVVSMRLYETRISSLQRCVAFMVLFHQMGKNVQDFWPKVSFGLLGYDMSRTHSIMRIATTASPVSGAEVRHRAIELARMRQVQHALDVMLRCVYRHRGHKHQKMVLHLTDMQRLSRAALSPPITPSNRETPSNKELAPQRTESGDELSGVIRGTPGGSFGGRPVLSTPGEGEGGDAPELAKPGRLEPLQALHPLAPGRLGLEPLDTLSPPAPGSIEPYPSAAALGALRGGNTPLDARVAEKDSDSPRAAIITASPRAAVMITTTSPYANASEPANGSKPAAQAILPVPAASPLARPPPAATSEVPAAAAGLEPLETLSDAAPPQGDTSPRAPAPSSPAPSSLAAVPRDDSLSPRSAGSSDVLRAAEFPEGGGPPRAPQENTPPSSPRAAAVHTVTFSPRAAGDSDVPSEDFDVPDSGSTAPARYSSTAGALPVATHLVLSDA